MIKQKDFFIRMCQMENVSIKELQELTGKSKSVVYEWLNYSNINCFPSYESLAKIICRLGITFDDFLKCRCDKLVDYNNYRTYKNYIIGDILNLKLSDDILNEPNCEYILNCYIHDYFSLTEMIDDYLLGLNVDMNKLESLCDHIKPCVQSDVEYALDDFGGGALYLLNSSNIHDYKDRTELFMDRLENDPEYKFSCNHRLIFPDINDILLKKSEEDTSLIRKYLLIITEKERNALIESYVNLVSENKHFDKNKKLFKILYKNNCYSNQLFAEVAKYVVTLKRVSIIEIQKQFKLPFSIAILIMNKLEEKNVVSIKNEGITRTVLMSLEDLKSNKII